MMRKDGSWSLGIYRRIYNSNLIEQILLGRWYYHGEKRRGMLMRKRKSSNTFRVINQMESALVEKRGSEKSIFKTRKFIKNI